MAHDLKSIVVLAPSYDKINALKLFLDHQSVLPCEVLESESPYYLRLRVAISPQEDDVSYTEIPLAHRAVLVILIDAPKKEPRFR